ncbi:restriction endonuclease subunit S [Saccharothrix violaceirubra]|uniref:Type I restriction enzyme S subunit n=1 Tax=Saccharothrix violaceirubra TaxID=413306 RepID=A0A7W7WYN8_9PSEU|nr:restriction endonuclease subunit S [Saccharothrix violaceirubra]MBB4968191.1 type I restriction enzyme S subunit [Saccharothrix violaceirubra]
MSDVRLGEVLNVYHGWAFPSKGCKDAELDSEPRLIRIGDFARDRSSRFEPERVQAYVAEYPRKFRLGAGDLLVAMTCQTADGEILGYPMVVPDDGRLYLHNQRIGRIEVDDTRLDERFAYYIFKTNDLNRQLYLSASGSKILHTAPDRIQACRIWLPLLDEQRRIASVLGALDDLIETNRKLMAGLAEAQLASFRRGWDGVQRRRLEEVATITMGQSPPGDTYNEDGEGVAFYQGVRDFGWRFPSRRIWTTKPTRLADRGDILVAVRAPVGELNIATEKTALGRGVGGLRAVGRQATLFQALQADTALWDIHLGTGTVFAAINKAGMAALSVPWIDDDSLESALSTMDSIISALDEEVVVLTKTRDELLPLLMSGRVRAKEI